jgi:hypothetical protein
MRHVILSQVLIFVEFKSCERGREPWPVIERELMPRMTRHPMKFAKSASCDRLPCRAGGNPSAGIPPQSGLAVESGGASLSLSPEESFFEPGGFAGVTSTAGIDSQQKPLNMT